MYGIKPKKKEKEKQSEQADEEQAEGDFFLYNKKDNGGKERILI